MSPHNNVLSRTILRGQLSRIANLQESVSALQAEAEDLKEERNQLRKENQALRRKLTHSRLIDDLLTTLNEEGPEEGREVPPTVRALYERLPACFSFPSFFDAAEDDGLDTDTARRCLQHFLNQQLLYQEGDQLTKTAPSAAGT